MAGGAPPASVPVGPASLGRRSARDADAARWCGRRSSPRGSQLERMLLAELNTPDRAPTRGAAPHPAARRRAAAVGGDQRPGADVVPPAHGRARWTEPRRPPEPCRSTRGRDPLGRRVSGRRARSGPRHAEGARSYRRGQPEIHADARSRAAGLPGDDAASRRDEPASRARASPVRTRATSAPPGRSPGVWPWSARPWPSCGSGGVSRTFPSCFPSRWTCGRRGIREPTFGNQLAFHFARFPPSDTRDVPALARALRRQMADAVRDGQIEANAVAMEFLGYRPLSTMLRVLPWTAGGELFSFNCADLADWPAGPRAVLRASRRERLSHPRRSSPARPRGILQPLREPEQRRRVVDGGRREPGRGGANHRGGPRGDGMDERRMNDGAGPTGARCGSPSSGPGPPGPRSRSCSPVSSADVTLFDDGRRPELLVGESLVPAVVPILRRLGIEEETAAFSRVKPGVSFIWSPTDRVSVTFNRFAPAVFPYAYNIPRPRFDEALLARAIASGVRHVPARARLRAVIAPQTRRGAGPRSRDAGGGSGTRWAPSAPHRRRHRTGPARGPRAGDTRPARASEGRRALRPLRGLPLGRRAGTGAHRARRGGLELVHSAPGAALDRRRAGPGRRGPPRAHPGRAARARHHDRPLALLHRRRRKAGDGRGDLLQLPADLRARLRAGLGHGGRRLRLRRPHALARGLPRAPLGRAARRRPGSVARTSARSRRQPSWTRRWPHTPTASTRCCLPGWSWWPISTMGGWWR